MTPQKNLSKDEISELKNIIKYQQNIIKNYQEKVKYDKLQTFLPTCNNPFAQHYYALYSLILGSKTPLTLLRGHIQMLQKKIINIDATNAFLLSEEFNLFEKNISTLYDIIAKVDTLHNLVPQIIQPIDLKQFLATYQCDNLINIACPDPIQLEADPLLLQLLFSVIITSFLQLNRQKKLYITISETKPTIIITCSCDPKSDQMALIDPGLSPLLHWISTELHGKIATTGVYDPILVVELPSHA